jgi:hypothetical protein
MKELQIFRIFALFPLIGILTPDLANGFNISFSSIPAEHIIVDVTLLICIAICSAGIMVAENSVATSDTTALA